MRITPVVVAGQGDANRLSAIGGALDSRLRVLSAGGVSMLAVRDDAPPQPEQVVRWVATLHDAVDIVPIRLDEGVRNEHDALELLHERAASFIAALRQIAGCTEFGVRVLVECKPVGAREHAVPGAKTSGKAYLRDRAKHYAAVDGIPPWLTVRAREWATAMSIPGMRARLDGPSPLVAFPQIALLVRREDKERLAQRYLETRHVLGAPTTLSGPWAPYSFVRSVDPGNV